MRNERGRTHLDDSNPVSIKYSLAHELLHFFTQGRIHCGGLGADFRNEGVTFFFVHAFFEEHFCRLRQYEIHKELDDVPAEVRRWCMEEILIYVGEHPRACSEIVKGALKALWV